MSPWELSYLPLSKWLKVVGNEKEGWSRRWQMIGIGLRPRRSRFVCLIILLSSLILCISVSAPVKQNEKAMSWRIGKTRQITCSVSFFWSTFVSCVIRWFQIKVSSYQNAADPAPQHCPLTYFYHYWRIIPALPINGEMNRCVNTKDGTLLSAAFILTQRCLSRH